MRFLTDQDVYAVTGRFFTSLGHDVVTASDLGLAAAADVDLLRVSQEQDRILVTRDRDYGALVFVQASGAGVIYLRMDLCTIDSVHAELERVLYSYSELELSQSFVVIEPASHRIRKPRPRLTP